MDKFLIKRLLRETLLNEKGDESQESEGRSYKELDKKSRVKYKKEYADIQHGLRDTLLTKSQVMKAAGLGDPDDAGDRKAFNAKVDREETEDGSIRQFNDKELAAVAKVVSNPSAYLDIANK